MFDLTQQELAIQEAGAIFTLKEVADKYKKEHRNLKRDFKEMVSTLNEKEVSLLKFEQSKFIAKTGRNTIKEIDTYKLDFKTLIWFIAKFDHSLRLKIVNYAFDKLQQDYIKAIEEKTKETNKLIKQINKLQASKFNSYDDGWFSMSRIVKNNGLDISVSEALDIMVSLEECKRVEIRTTKIIANEESKICKFDTKRGLLFKGEETKSKLLQLI